MINPETQSAELHFHPACLTSGRLPLVIEQILSGDVTVCPTRHFVALEGLCGILMGEVSHLEQLLANSDTPEVIRLLAQLAAMKKAVKRIQAASSRR